MYSLLQEKKKSLNQFLNMIRDDTDIIVPIANGEPQTLLNELDKRAKRFHNVKVHQMHAQKPRDYILGKERDHLRYIAYFLSSVTRKPFLEGLCDLVPNDFHEVPDILRRVAKRPLVITAASQKDQHGYFSLGTQADYVASFIGEFPFFLEVNENMPRTFGGNQIHISQIEGFIESNYPLYELNENPPSETDYKIAEHVAERIEHRSTLQVGIGRIPNAILSKLYDKKDLGIHTELLTDGVIDLVKQGVITGNEKNTYRGKIVATFVLGTKKLYDFVDNNTGIEMLPVDIVNDPRIIGQEERMISINATTEVDFLGQCASETIGGKYYSSSGGQSDFARGAMFSKYGKGFICMHSTSKNETISKIRPQLSLGSAVTTSKNDVDHVVTEYGVAELRGKSIKERTLELINIAHPKFREELLFEAKKAKFLL